jgi:serine/threonine-protein kinase HipA
MFARYVFIQLPGEDQPVAAGLFTLDPEPGVGRFSYGKKYLLRPNAIAIDPINLPLSENEFTTKINGGIFFVLADILPDSWGKYVLARKLAIPFGALPTHEYFQFVTNHAVGAVSIGESLDTRNLKTEPLLQFSEIDRVMAAYDTLTTAETIPAEVLLMLGQGTSLGGAQPKAPVLYDGDEWIAKFKNKKVIIDFPTIEFATMKLAEKCGINIPEIRLETVSHEKVYLIKRFDREKGARIPFISGHALSSLDVDDLEKGSYLLLAGYIRQITKSVNKDLQELFKRMVFNTLIGNADDHLRNHGWLFTNKEWRLSPAYDILPIPRKTKDFSLSLIAGDYGTKGNTENGLSQCEKFNLSKNEAAIIIEKMRLIISSWKDHYQDCGVSSQDIKEIEMAINFAQ